MRRSTRALYALAVATALALGSPATSGAGTVHVEPLVTFPLPPAAAGCRGATGLAGGAKSIPITVSTVAGQVAEMVNVCIGGLGPYPFFIDSGAGESVIDARLAARLRLADHGPPRGFAGVGCTGTAQPVEVKSWSAGGVALDPQLLGAVALPDFGTPGEPEGLLGSDVLSRFGAVRLDFTAQTLTLGGPERPLSKSAAHEVHGPTGAPLSAVLTHGQAGTTTPLTVVLSPGDISLNVRLRFGRGPARNFIVDTGASQSIVASSVVKPARLAPTDLAQRQATVCSVITLPLVHSGRWSIPGVVLRPQLLGAAYFGRIGVNGTAGLLGSDQLRDFGWVIFDYRGGRLVLG